MCSCRLVAPDCTGGDVTESAEDSCWNVREGSEGWRQTSSVPGEAHLTTVSSIPVRTFSNVWRFLRTVFNPLTLTCRGSSWRGVLMGWVSKSVFRIILDISTFRWRCNVRFDAYLLSAGTSDDGRGADVDTYRGECLSFLFPLPQRVIGTICWLPSTIPEFFPTRSNHCKTLSESGFSWRLGRTDSTSENRQGSSSTDSCSRSSSELIGKTYGRCCRRYSPNMEELFSSLSWDSTQPGSLPWRDRQLELRCLDDAGVLFVWLLFEASTSCNLMRQGSKPQLWAEPEDEDVKVPTLEQELGRLAGFETVGLLHRNRGSSAERIACRRPFTHTVRTNSGLCEDCHRAGMMMQLPSFVCCTHSAFRDTCVRYARYLPVIRSSVNILSPWLNALIVAYQFTGSLNTLKY
jgi:hypothetical protein